MRRKHHDIFLSCLLLLVYSCPAYAQTVQLVDAAKNPVSEYFLSNPDNKIYVLITDGPVGNVTVTVKVTINEEDPPPHPGDIETITLTESPANSGVYFGPVDGLVIKFSHPFMEDNIVEGKANDQVFASYGNTHLSSAVPLTKHPTASVVDLVDHADAAKNDYLIGTEDVWIRISDEDQNEVPDAEDTITVVLTSDGGDNETLTLTETGINSGIFRGSMSSEINIITVGDGTLQATDTNKITAAYTDPNDSSDTSSDTAYFTISSNQEGRIIVDKITEPAGAPQSFNFTLTGGPDSINRSFTLTDAAAPYNSDLLKPGAYTLSESLLPADWGLSSALCDNGSAPGEIKLDPGEIVRCTFTNIKRTLTVASIQKGSGRGTVSSKPAGINCGDTCTVEFAGESSVTLIATPQNGSTFTGWSGACSGTGSCIVHMSADQTVSAEFYKFTWLMVLPAITF